MSRRASLTDDQVRAVVRLSETEGVAVQEIATRLGVPASTCYGVLNGQIGRQVSGKPPYVRKRVNAPRLRWKGLEW